MGRSNGYRPKRAVRAEVLAWREKLHLLQDDQWQKASVIMDNITTLLGHHGGPMGGKIQPRACKFCHYYGHTIQWCNRRKAVIARNEALEIAHMLREDAELFDRYEGAKRPERDPHDPSGQGKVFNELFMPYTIAPNIGVIVGGRTVRRWRQNGLYHLVPPLYRACLVQFTHRCPTNRFLYE